MPTKDRLQARAAADEELPLKVAAPRTGYTSETLRKMKWDSPDPPPLFKRNGRWLVRVGDLDAWIARRRAVEVSA